MAAESDHAVTEGGAPTTHDDGAKVIGVDHFSITVADLERSLAFWRDLMGFEQIVDFEEDREGAHLDEIIGLEGIEIDSAYVKAPGITVELMKYLSPEGEAIHPRTCDPGCTHIAFTCNDLEAMFDRLRAAGVTTRADRVVEVPDGDWGGTKAFYCLDPDGVTVELISGH
jgi:catechol 2,3-dioxygenase-like lactoylglutathione lyase family enzyme